MTFTIQWDLDLWILVIILNYIFAFLMIPRFRKPETEIFGKYFKGVFLFFMIHGLSRIAYLINDFYVPSPIIYEIGVDLGIASIVVFMYYIESTIFTKTHRGFFIFGVIGLVIATASLILDIYGQNTVILSIITQYVVVQVLGIVVPLIYLYIAIISTGRVRQNSLIIMFGIIIFIFGQMTHTPTAVTNFGDWIRIASPILMATGLAIFYIGLARGQK